MSKAVSAGHVKHLRQQLLAEWNRFVRYQPPGKRLVWLENAYGLVAHGAKQRKNLVAELRHLRTWLQESFSSEEWMEAVFERGETYRGEFMAVGRGLVRYGDGKPTHRLTPRYAVKDEDTLDTMAYERAAYYDYPPSPSAMAILRIGHMRGREVDAVYDEDPGSTDRRKCRKPRLNQRLRRGKDKIRPLVLTRQILPESLIGESLTAELNRAASTN